MNRQHGRRRGHSVFYGCRPDDIAKAIVVCEAAGQIGHAELCREMRKGGLALVAGFDRQHAIAAAVLGGARHSTLVVVSDDDYHATGPRGWRSAAVITSWARAALIHAAGADRESYKAAAEAARLVGRAVLIETSSDHANSWAELVQDKPALVISPRGGPHPILPPRSAVH
jgi:hypothetical protein